MFDWTRILKGEEAKPEPRSRPEGAERRQRSREGGPRNQPPAPAAPAARPVAAEPGPYEPPPEPQPEGLPAPVLAFDADGTVVQVPELEPPPGAESPPPQAALARLGSEGLIRLRARYAEVLARISEKAAEPAQRDELKARAERLNPDAWVTDEEVTAGLEQYETVFESLRAVVGRRRKRRRRRGGGDADSQQPEEARASAPDADAERDDEPGSEGNL